MNKEQEKASRETVNLDNLLPKRKYEKGDINEKITADLLNDKEVTFEAIRHVYKAILNPDYEKLLKATKGVNLNALFYSNKPLSMGPFGDPKPYFGERLPIMGGVNLCMIGLTGRIFGFTARTSADGEKLKEGYKIIQHLLDLGLEINMTRDESNMTLLLAVVLCYEKYKNKEDKETLDKVIALLLRKGANPNIVNSFFGSVREIFEENRIINDSKLYDVCPNYKAIINHMNKYDKKHVHDHKHFVDFVSQPYKDFFHSDLVNNFTRESLENSSKDSYLFRSSRLPKVGEYVEHIYIFDEKNVVDGKPLFKIKDTKEGDDNGFAAEGGDLNDGTNYKYYRYRYRVFDVQIGNTNQKMNLYSFNAPIDPYEDKHKGQYIMHFIDAVKRGPYYFFYAYTMFDSTKESEELLAIKFYDYSITYLNDENHKTVLINKKQTLKSSLSKAEISIEILQAPQNVSINNGILSWDEVEGAVSYKVIVNDIEYITTNTYYNFSTVDTINIYVISINENGQSDKAGIIYAEKW